MIGEVICFWVGFSTCLILFMTGQIAIEVKQRGSE